MDTLWTFAVGIVASAAGASLVAFLILEGINPITWLWGLRPGRRARARRWRSETGGWITGNPDHPFLLPTDVSVTREPSSAVGWNATSRTGGQGDLT